MSLNTVKAILILNSWSAEARAKAAAKRKKKGIAVTKTVQGIQELTRGKTSTKSYDKKTEKGKAERKLLAQQLTMKVGGISSKEVMTGSGPNAKERRRPAEEARSKEIAASKKAAKRSNKQKRNWPMGGYD